jgi:hypothetical protein
MGMGTAFFRSGIFVVALLLGGTAQAKSLTSCTSDGLGCRFAAMPLYRQTSSVLADYSPNRDPMQSQLCTPTASAMALGAITFDNVEYYTSSWVAKNFVNRTMKERVKAFMDLLGTSIAGGTLLTAMPNFAALASSFPKAKAGNQYGSSTLFSAATISKNVNAGILGIVSIGFFAEKCATSSTGTKLCSYTRVGGHTEAVNGHALSTFIRYHDPQFGTAHNLAPVAMPNNSGASLLGIKIALDNRPFGKNSMITGSGFMDLIESFHGIDTN